MKRSPVMRLFFCHLLCFLKPSIDISHPTMCRRSKKSPPRCKQREQVVIRGRGKDDGDITEQLGRLKDLLLRARVQEEYLTMIVHPLETRSSGVSMDRRLSRPGDARLRLGVTKTQTADSKIDGAVRSRKCKMRLAFYRSLHLHVRTFRKIGNQKLFPSHRSCYRVHPIFFQLQTASSLAQCGCTCSEPYVLPGPVAKIRASRH